MTEKRVGDNYNKQLPEDDVQLATNRLKALARQAADENKREEQHAPNSKQPADEALIELVSEDKNGRRVEAQTIANVAVKSTGVTWSISCLTHSGGDEPTTKQWVAFTVRTTKLTENVRLGRRTEVVIDSEHDYIRSYSFGVSQKLSPKGPVKAGDELQVADPVPIGVLNVLLKEKAKYKPLMVAPKKPALVLPDSMKLQRKRKR